MHDNSFCSSALRKTTVLNIIRRKGKCVCVRFQEFNLFFNITILQAPYVCVHCLKSIFLILNNNNTTLCVPQFLFLLTSNAFLTHFFCHREYVVFGTKQKLFHAYISIATPAPSESWNCTEVAYNMLFIMNIGCWKFGASCTFRTQVQPVSNVIMLRLYTDSS